MSSSGFVYEVTVTLSSGVVVGPFTVTSPVDLPGATVTVSKVTAPVDPPVDPPAPVDPTLLPDYPQSGRGQYNWMNSPPADPADWPQGGDLYQRDFLNWRTKLEKTRGKYDLSSVETVLADAHSRGGRAMFRVMPWMNPGAAPLAPSWIPTKGPAGAPDWNSSTYINSWVNLMTAIGARYGRDPRLFAVDISGLHAWGEGYLESGWGTPMSLANYRTIVDATIAAFPTPYLQTCAFRDPGFEYMDYAMSKSPRVGWRFDNVGGMQLTLDGNPTVENQWKTAPVTTEWGPGLNRGADGQLCNARVALDNVRDLHIGLLSSGNHATPYAAMSAVEQEAYRTVYKLCGARLTATVAVPSSIPEGRAFDITSTWTNYGVAPTYDDWTPGVVLRNRSTDVSTVAPLDGVNLRSVTGGNQTPDARTFTSRVVFPQTPGSYEVSVTARHPFLPPLQLAMPGRTTDGRYVVGGVTVTS